MRKIKIVEYRRGYLNIVQDTRSISDSALRGFHQAANLFDFPFKTSFYFVLHESCISILTRLALEACLLVLYENEIREAFRTLSFSLPSYSCCLFFLSLSFRFFFSFTFSSSSSSSSSVLLFFPHHIRSMEYDLMIHDDRILLATFFVSSDINDVS